MELFKIRPNESKEDFYKRVDEELLKASMVSDPDGEEIHDAIKKEEYFCIDENGKKYKPMFNRYGKVIGREYEPVRITSVMVEETNK